MFKDTKLALTRQPPPREQLAGAHSVPLRRCRNIPSHRITLRNNPLRRLRRPSTTRARRNHLKVGNLWHSRMVIHTPMSSSSIPTDNTVITGGIPRIQTISLIAGYWAAFASVGTYADVYLNSYKSMNLEPIVAMSSKSRVAVPAVMTTWPRTPPLDTVHAKPVWKRSLSVAICDELMSAKERSAGPSRVRRFFTFPECSRSESWKRKNL